MIGRVMALAAVAAVTVAVGGVQAKPGTPGPAYFEDTYQRIGRSGGAAPTLIDDRVAITAVGDRVAIQSCSGPETLMGFGPAFEIENLMTGLQAGVPVECLFHNNGYNRPILTCRASDGAAWTLWPSNPTGRGQPLACGG